MPDLSKNSKFNYSKDNHPIVITSEEQFQQMRAAAKKEKEELLKEIAARDKGKKQG